MLIRTNNHAQLEWITRKTSATISTNEITFFTSLEIGRLGQDQNTIAVRQVATTVVTVCITKVCTLKNNTNLSSIFSLIKSSEIGFIFLPAFYLIIWLMASPKNFEKIAILKI